MIGIFGQIARNILPCPILFDSCQNLTAALHCASVLPEHPYRLFNAISNI